jgi:hypothetical protein
LHRRSQYDNIDDQERRNRSFLMRRALQNSLLASSLVFAFLLCARPASAFSIAQTLEFLDFQTSEQEIFSLIRKS